jgi:hypothetical protein
LHTASHHDRFLEASIKGCASAVYALMGVDFSIAEPGVTRLRQDGIGQCKFSVPEKKRLQADLNKHLSEARTLLKKKDNLLHDLEATLGADDPEAVVGMENSTANDVSGLAEASFKDLNSRVTIFREESFACAEAVERALAELEITGRHSPIGRGDDSMPSVYRHLATAAKFAELESFLHEGIGYYYRECDDLDQLSSDVDGFSYARHMETVDIRAARQLSVGVTPQVCALQSGGCQPASPHISCYPSSQGHLTLQQQYQPQPSRYPLYRQGQDIQQSLLHHQQPSQLQHMHQPGTQPGQLSQPPPPLSSDAPPPVSQPPLDGSNGRGHLSYWKRE